MAQLADTPGLEGPLSAEELVRRAQGLAPFIAERAAEGEANRALPDDVVEAIASAGLFNLFKPREFGGHEADWHTVLDVCAAVGAADGSTSWVLNTINIAHWIATMFDERCQEEIFGAGPDVRCAGVLIPREGYCVAVDGGFHVPKAKWGFGTGTTLAQWVVFAIPLVNDKGEMIDQVFAQVPIEDIDLFDDWHVSAMRATASGSVGLEDVFIPEHRTLMASAAMTGQYRNQHIADRWLYRSVLSGSFSVAVTGTIVGLAGGVFDGTVARVDERVISYTMTPQSQATITHMQLGEARMKLDSARMHAHRAADTIEQFAQAGDPMPLDMRAQTKADCGWATRLAGEVGELCGQVCGGSVIREADPMNRMLRDLRTLKHHGYVLPQTQIELLGRVLCGQPPQTFVV